jgi:predicted DNA-binding protein with PD1-like motif
VSLVKYWESKEHNGLIILTLGYGDLLLESIQQVVREADIHTGVLLTGLGSLTRGHIHTVVSNEVPPENLFLKIPGPLEVVQFSGIIANYEPHVHISLMDKDGKFYGGHLEPDSEVLTLSEISLLRLPDVRLTRRNRGGPFKLLDGLDN